MQLQIGLDIMCRTITRGYPWHPKYFERFDKLDGCIILEIKSGRDKD